MPGIAGIISKKPHEKNKQQLNLMIDCMKHEPFYSYGTYMNDKLSLYAGWVCHKGSFSDCMPVQNEKRDLLMIFSGENYTDKALTEQLKRRGHEFDSSDASYLIHLYEEDEYTFFLNLNGWFSGLIVDLRKEKVIIFNDRYRMQRVYYHEDRNSFYFSSEAKALLKIKPDLRRIDMRSLGQFFSCGCVLQDRSLFSNVSILPGGSAWTFSNGKCQKNENYIKPSSWESQPVLRKEKFYEKLKDMFPKILTRYFRTKNPISISLTSGLDTRMILSCLDNSFGRFPCYTFSGMYLDSLDARIARKVAEACRYNHDIIRLDRNFLAHFSNYAEKTIYVTDGCHDICGTHDIYLNKLAREIAPIRMTGKFGSEVLRDLSQLKAISIGNQLFHPDFQKHVTKAVRTLNEIKKGNDLTFAVFKEMPLHEFGCLAIEQSQLTVRTPYMDNALVELVYRAPAKTRSSAEVPLRLIKDKSPELFKIMTDRGTAGTPNNISSKLAQIFYYFLFKTEYVYLYQLPHWLGKIDYRFSPFNAENLILGRYQLGHYRIWFRNELSDYVREILLDRRAVNRPYLNKKLLEDMVNRHISGERNYLREINKLMTVEMIHRLLIEDI